MQNFVDSMVYFRCPKRSWIVGILESWDPLKGGSCRATRDGGDVVTKLTEDDVHPIREGSQEDDVNDLLMLTDLHDSTLLHCIQRRFLNDVIYTNIGAIVVAVNPFNFKIPRYMDNMMSSYLSEGDTIQKSLPHSWACAHNTYFEMKNDQRDQTILISGESGAGKTEATKIVMKYLAALSCLRGEEKNREAASQIGRKITLSSPPLEAFGNAKTVRNDNSSRFGKFMRVKFDGNGYLVGAHTTKYLLEKSRIVTSMPGERVYHSFYLLLRSKKKADYMLEDEKKYVSVNRGKMTANKEYDTEQEFEEVNGALTAMGVPADSIASVWRVVAGVLHFENIEFIPDGEGCLISATSQEALAKGCNVWKISASAYEAELKETTLTIMGKPVKRVMTPSQAEDARSALNKAVYDANFSWLVEQCNKMLDCTECKNWIGLLDIFGFEAFTTNSFEQLCINLTNETLQHHYNTYIFCKDLDECRAEGVDVSGVPFPDNTPCLKLIAGQGSILALLDEECQLGSGTDASFLEKIKGKFSTHEFFCVQKLARTTFSIRHYACDVTYEVAGFREKNLDTLKDAWKLIMRESGDAHVRGLLAAPVETKGPKPTVGGYFKKQLGELMELINSTNPHWIRCIKPHPAKKPLMFDGVTVMSQLSSAGVLGTVKIRKAGYAVRIVVDQFVAQYKIIAVARGVEVSAKGILGACGYSKTDAQIGSKRVFLRSHVYLDIEGKKKEALTGSAKVVQAYSSARRGFLLAQKCVYAANKRFIDAQRALAMKLLNLMKLEVKRRAHVEAKSRKQYVTMAGKLKNALTAAREIEQRRREELLAAIAAKYDKLFDDLHQTEATYRTEIARAMETGFELIEMKCHEEYQIASEREARREHKIAEEKLMNERRSLREARRQQELDRMIEQTAVRLDPTIMREDHTTRAIQRNLQAKEKEVEVLLQRAAEENERRRIVEQRVNQKRIEREKRRQSEELLLWKSTQHLARAKSAYDRYGRVLSEDYDWQRLERQILKGQELALEEQRRVFLRHKSTEETVRREKQRIEETRLQEQKDAEIRAIEKQRATDEEERLHKKKMEERKIFNALSTFREEMKLREKAQRVQASIAWENDRKERMVLQRPDISRHMMDRLPLSQRVGAPEAFTMAGGNVTFSKVWTPFRVVKFQAAPSTGVATGAPFTVSWLLTRCIPYLRIVVSTGAGEIARYRITTSAGDTHFTAPKEWFSELAIDLLSGEQEAHGSIILPRVAQI